MQDVGIYDGTENTFGGKVGYGCWPLLPNAGRDTIVVELTCDRPVGTDSDGDARVCRYLDELAGILGLAPVSPPRTHLSTLYGLSGWVPLEERSAIHLYAWDDRNPSFVSVDLATPLAVDHAVVERHATWFFGSTPDRTVCKSMLAGGDDWRDLAPTICRQRLAVRGAAERPLTPRRVQRFLRDLSKTLDMLALSSPMVRGQTAWMHWETSGVIIDWSGDIALDIYTCKPFVAERAAAFAMARLDIRGLRYWEY
ncbi:MAG: hypothetical protein OQJ76_01290 [Rhodospirillales bacterium]|nr:hypothetical protein [Rhodospirillales bacterium]MCW9039103.1 hypothetical protein [Rhodospirillales bacterium]